MSFLLAILDIATSPILLTGLYVWSITVAPAFRSWFAQANPTAEAGHSILWVRLISLAAIVFLGAGVFLKKKGSQLAPWVGVWLFLGACSSTWLLASSSLDKGHFDPFRGTLGSAGFVLYTLAWGVPHSLVRRPPEDNPRADISLKLEARGQPVRGPWVLLAVGLVTSSALMAFAWQAHDAPRSLLIQAIAGLASIALVTASASIVVGFREERTPGYVRVRLRRAAPAFSLLLVTLALGLAYTWASR